MLSFEALHREMHTCRKCLDAGFEIVPGAIFSGRETAKVMIIGQAPGATEVVARRPFNAGSGSRLFQWLGQAGWDEETFRQTQYMTAVTKCYPGKSDSGRGDRVPTKKEQGLCRPFLVQEILMVQPRLIIPVGRLAINLFYESRARLADVIGSAVFIRARSITGIEELKVRKGIQFEHLPEHIEDSGAWIVPLPHPSGASSWPNLDQNQLLIRRAIELLARLRVVVDC